MGETALCKIFDKYHENFFFYEVKNKDKEMLLLYIFFNNIVFIMTKVEWFKPQKENCNVHTSYNAVAMPSNVVLNDHVV